MSTSGLIGFYKNGTSKITYTHSDSSPEYLGTTILEELRKYLYIDGIPFYQDQLLGLNYTFSKIQLVEKYAKPTPDLWALYWQFYQNVHRNDTWYALLRSNQGTLKNYFSGRVIHMTNDQEFIKKSMFCEWAYILNLDNDTLEVWRGSQESRNTSRYSVSMPYKGYYACKLLMTIPFNNMPGSEKFVRIVRENEVCSVTWALTYQGEQWVDDNEDKLFKDMKNLDSKEGRLLDLLLAVDDDFYCVDPEASGEDNFETYLKQYEERMGVPSPTTIDIFNKAIKDGLIIDAKVNWVN